MTSDDLTPLTRRAEALLDHALKAGATAADVIAVHHGSISVEIRSGTLEEITRSEASDLGLRVFDGRRTAIISTSEIRPDNFADIAARAVAMAKVAPEDPYAGLAEPDALADPATLDREIAALDMADGEMPDATALEAAARAADAAARIDGITNTETSASASQSASVLVTSAGFSAGYLGSRHGVSASAVAGSGTEMERDYAYSYKRHRVDMASPDEIGREAADKALKRLAPRKADTQSVTVVYDPRVAGGLIGSLAGAINGAAIARGTSFLKDRMGDRLFAAGVTVTDDPKKRRGLGSRPFDGDGLPTRALNIIDDGVLTTWLMDLATARELGLASTGHAARSVSSAPSPSPSNLTLMPGSATREDLLRDVGTGFYVTELIGMGANLVTGDYSRGAAGFWIENGELAYPVSEVTIAGTLGEMFSRLVPARDLEDRYGINAPTVAIEGMTLAGR